MLTIELTNVGQPFTDEEAAPSGGQVIQFSLCDSNGAPTDALDKFTGEHILPIPINVTSASEAADGLAVGEFSVFLWPTDQAVGTVYYAVKLLGAAGGKTYVKQLPSTKSVLSWFEFLTGGQLASAAEVADSTGDVVTDSTGETVYDSTLGGI